ncbi:SRPBCC family protein [Paenibacillus nasutitermitis]|uniref:Polyketide cyclase n=1 Tax=Paenibacillus nasutitermitis TaxID=1652958 RepID=A0A916ZEY4_9BACL|nr:SRPBCC family protein [Paenibacillus nasutitermitis]GGD93215.1 polyketide cyclase [Paenibacillus nasutitermitis]
MTELLQSRIISVQIANSPRSVYEYAMNPGNFPEWTSSFSRSVRQTGGEWIVETPDGPMAVAFAAPNEWGILDHHVRLASGQKLFNPMRVIPNGEGCEVHFTLFRQPDMSDQKFAEDAGMVQRDLESLKSRMEA